MSYCRMSENSDVYLVATGEGERSFWSCVGCHLARRQILGQVEVAWTELATLQEALQHLYKHRAEGDKVPGRAIKRLRKEIAAESRGEE